LLNRNVSLGAFQLPKRINNDALANCFRPWFALTFAACSDPSHYSRTAKGALIGGAVGADAGALVGYANGAPVTGAVVGAGLGALGGTAIGATLEDHHGHRALAERLSHGVPVDIDGGCDEWGGPGQNGEQGQCGEQGEN
jgi:hypothetical protein